MMGSEMRSNIWRLVGSGVVTVVAYATANGSDTVPIVGEPLRYLAGFAMIGGMLGILGFGGQIIIDFIRRLFG